jgi:SlyX protein
VESPPSIPRKALRELTDQPSRIIHLEMAVAHLEHQLEQMHTVLLAVQAELKASRDRVSKIEHRIVLLQSAEESRDPTEERPPHY